MLVCHCAVVNDARIRLALDDGARDLLDVAAACGAGALCGGCIPVIASLLAERHGHSPSTLIGRSSRTAGDVGPVLVKGSQQVALALTADIAAGRLAETRLIDMRDVARDQGVSPGVAQRALTILAHHGIAHHEAGHLSLRGPDPSMVIEAAGIHLLAARITGDHVLAAHRCLRDLQASARPEDPFAAMFVRLLDHVDTLRATARHVRATPGEVPGVPEVAGTAGHRPRTEAVRRVLALILDRELTPGEQLGTEEDVRAAVGVEAAVLRDSLPLIEYYGLASRRPGRRAQLVVGAPDPWPVAQLLSLVLDSLGASAANLVAVRQAVEGQAAHLAAHRSAEHAGQLLARHLESEEAVRRRGLLVTNVSDNLHPLVGELSGNPALALFTTAAILSVVHEVRRATDGHGQRHTEEFLSSEGIRRAHAAIVAAITAGDAQRSAALMVDHIATHLPRP